MANVRSTDNDARLIEQLARGRRTRYTQSLGFSVAEDRATNDTDSLIMADAIKNETLVKAFFVAPCDGKVVRIVANGSPFIDMATSGTVTAKLTKAVIGGSDTDLCSTIAIGAATVPTLDTAIDAVLSTTATDLDLLNGQHVYLTAVVSNHTVSLIGYVTVTMEWVPTDIGYAQS